jgi:hypothetical protein
MLYFIVSMAIDMEMFISILEKNFVAKLGVISLSFFHVGILLSLTISSASMSKIAHSPYAKLNSIIAKRTFTLADKFKIVSLTEKLAGPDIAVYCLDLFPLNNYEFFLLISVVATNFFLLLKQINKNLIENKLANHFT